MYKFYEGKTPSQPFFDNLSSLSGAQRSRRDYTDKQLLRDLLEIVTSADFPSQDGLSFKAEIDALRTALAHLQETFTQAESLEEQLKLSGFTPAVPPAGPSATSPPASPAWFAPRNTSKRTSPPP